MKKWAVEAHFLCGKSENRLRQGGLSNERRGDANQATEDAAPHH